MDLLHLDQSLRTLYEDLCESHLKIKGRLQMIFPKSLSQMMQNEKILVVKLQSPNLSFYITSLSFLRNSRFLNS